MMKKVYILGNKGNMGRRYTAILKHLGVAVAGCDLDDWRLPPKDCDGIIIATPTSSHLELLEACLRIGDRPILCEKPFTTDIEAMRRFVHRRSELNRIRMVNQYEHLPGTSEPVTHGVSRYNYFNHGRDGLAYDCVNILGMAMWNCSLEEYSPKWICWLNGHRLKIEDMDYAYIEMINDWTTCPKSNMEYALAAHEKAAAWRQS
jgi:hypothetical protein